MPRSGRMARKAVIFNPAAGAAPSDLVVFRRDGEAADDLGADRPGLQPRPNAGAAKPSSGLQSDLDETVLVLGPAAALDADRFHVAPLDMVFARTAVAPNALDANVALPDDPEGAGHAVCQLVDSERRDRADRQQCDV